MRGDARIHARTFVVSPGLARVVESCAAMENQVRTHEQKHLARKAYTRIEQQDINSRALRHYEAIGDGYNCEIVSLTCGRQNVFLRF